MPIDFVNSKITDPDFCEQSKSWVLPILIKFHTQVFNIDFDTYLNYFFPQLLTI